MSSCPYCHNSRALLVGQIYCSNHGPRMESLHSGAFQYQGPRVESTEHISRLSIRTSLHGEYHLRVGSRDFRVRPGSYVLINQGQRYQSEVGGPGGEEMFGVAFKPALVLDAYRTLTRSHEALLDLPTGHDGLPLHFWELQFPLDEAMDGLIRAFRHAMDHAGRDELDLDWMYGSLLERLMQNQYHLYQQSQRIPMVKASTRTELFRRLCLAREYMEAHYAQSLTLEEIASEACLSPFHFLRLFREVFGQTPHRFLTLVRLEAARKLLAHTHLPINEVCIRVGFTDPSSFGRLFRREVGQTPAGWRQSHLPYPMLSA